jgi:integrase
MATTFICGNKIYMSIFINGKQIKRSSKLANTRENLRYVQRVLLPKFTEEFESPHSNTSLDYYIDKYLKEKKHLLKERTYIRYHKMIEKWIRPKYGNHKLTSLKISVLKDFINSQYSLGKSAKTVELYRTVFSGILQEAVYDGVIASNPFSNIKRMKKKKPKIQPLSPTEVKLILANTSGWFRNYIGIATHLGLRSGELIGLKWTDIDDKHIKVRRTRDDGRCTLPKTASSIRDLPMFYSVKPFIESQRSLTGHLEYVFYSYRKQPFASTNAINQHHWYPLLDKLDLPRRRLYELRHTFATNMLNSGHFKVTDIARMMGHTTTEYLFNVYSRYIESEQDKIPLDISIY